MCWLYLRVDMPFWFGQTHRGRHSMHFEECLRELFAQNWSLPNLRQAEEKRAAVGVSEQPFVPWTHPNSKMVQLPKESMLYCLTRALPSILFSLYAKMFVTFCVSSHWHGTEAVIVGGGQCGLALAARLQRLGVSYIVVDQNQRPGDSWRKRHMAWWTGVEKGGGFGWNYVKGVSKRCACLKLCFLQLHTWQVTWYRSCLVYRFQCCSQNFSHDVCWIPSDGLDSKAMTASTCTTLFLPIIYRIFPSRTTGPCGCTKIRWQII